MKNLASVILGAPGRVLAHQDRPLDWSSVETPWP